MEFITEIDSSDDKYIIQEEWKRKLIKEGIYSSILWIILIYKVLLGIVTKKKSYSIILWNWHV